MLIAKYRRLLLIAAEIPWVGISELGLNPEAIAGCQFILSPRNYPVRIWLVIVLLEQRCNWISEIELMRQFLS